MKLLHQLERKYGKYAIPNLMKYLIILYALGFALELFVGGYSRYLALDFNKVLQGEVWRLFTFVIGPPNTSIWFIIFSLYLYYMIGSVLETVWGSFRFNLYMLSGWFFNVLAAAILYFGFGMNTNFTTYFINMSLFLAFAVIAGDMVIYLFFILPVKIKWLAWLDLFYFGFIIVGGILHGVGILPIQVVYSIYLKTGIALIPEASVQAFVALLNFFIFVLSTRNMKRYSWKEQKRKKEFFNAQRQAVESHVRGYVHKCAVCGRTEKDDPSLEFRYCSKCEGNYEYCQDHLYTHKHVTADRTSDPKNVIEMK
ncbi:MAG: rhomboid family intramembrane serine protease [Lachnospiraceae bacterium]|nr:rhomboid family intramembrane serine protease [Lachnospiraceae bacterium]